MRSLIVPYPDSPEFGILYPVPRSKLALLDFLIQKLRESWREAGFQVRQLTETHWFLFQAIAAIVPTEPVLPFNLERIKGDDLTLQQVFLVGVDDSGEIMADGKLNPSQLETLHLFEPREPMPKGPDDPIDPPFPTSGDSEADGIANLMGPFGVKGALKIWNTFDQRQIDNILYTWNELQKPLDQRRQEYIAKLFFQEIQNPEYQRSMLEDW